MDKIICVQSERLNPEEEFDPKFYNDPNSDYWKFEHQFLCDSPTPKEI